jgi:hypothetical protein
MTKDEIVKELDELGKTLYSKFGTDSYIERCTIHDLKDKFKALTIPDVSVCAEKPPLGLKPRKFVDEDRLREVQGAMVRYYDANKPMPLEWITEYNELVERLH